MRTPYPLRITVGSASGDVAKSPESTRAHAQATQHLTQLRSRNSVDLKAISHNQRACKSSFARKSRHLEVSQPTPARLSTVAIGLQQLWMDLDATPKSGFPSSTNPQRPLGLTGYQVVSVGSMAVKGRQEENASHHPSTLDDATQPFALLCCVRVYQAFLSCSPTGLRRLRRTRFRTLNRAEGIGLSLRNKSWLHLMTILLPGRLAVPSMCFLCLSH